MTRFLPIYDLDVEVSPALLRCPLGKVQAIKNFSQKAHAATRAGLFTTDFGLIRRVVRTLGSLALEKKGKGVGLTFLPASKETQ